MSTKTFEATCACGATVFELSRDPIMTVVCHCTSCQTAGLKLANEPSVPSVVGACGGTEFVMFRKDRVHYARGSESLREHRLTPQSPTRRVVAGCCGAPMFLEFQNGHWLSIYRARLGMQAPPIEMRVMTRDRPKEIDLPKDVPSYATHSVAFMWRLLLAWVAMGFKAPKGPTASPV